MIRSLTLAAIAVLIAAPASARSIKIDVSGKTAAQAQTEIATAARKVCVSATGHATFRHAALQACLKDATAQANAQLAAAQRGASQVASN